MSKLNISDCMFFASCRRGIETLDPECAKVLIQNKQHIGLFDFERIFEEVSEKRRYGWLELPDEENRAYQEKIDEIWNPFFFPKPFQKLSSCEDAEVSESFFILGVEYAIGAHSYVVSHVAECIKANIDSLSESALNQILSLVGDYLKDCKEAQEVSPEIKVWESVQKALSKKLNIGFLGITELAKIFGYNRRTVSKLVQRRLIKTKKVGVKHLIKQEDFENYIKSKKKAEESKKLLKA